MTPTVVVRDQIRQLERVGRFRDVVRKTRDACLLAVGRLAVTGHRNQQRCRVRRLAQRSRDIISVQTGKADVTHDHVRLMPERGVKTGPTVMRLDDFMTDLPQVGGEHLGHIDVVINDEHPFRRGRAGTALRPEG